MVGTASEPPDQLTSVARAVTGAYYVIPSADRLAAFGVGGSPVTAAPTPNPVRAAG